MLHIWKYSIKITVILTSMTIIVQRGMNPFNFTEIPSYILNNNAVNVFIYQGGKSKEWSLQVSKTTDLQIRW